MRNGQESCLKPTPIYFHQDIRFYEGLQNWKLSCLGSRMGGQVIVSNLLPFELAIISSWETLQQRPFLSSQTLLFPACIWFTSILWMFGNIFTSLPLVNYYPNIQEITPLCYFTVYLEALPSKLFFMTTSSHLYCVYRRSQ